MECPRCQEEKNILYPVPQELQFIMKFKTLCPSCDRKVRLRHLEELEEIILRKSRRR